MVGGDPVADRRVGEKLEEERYGQAPKPHLGMVGSLTEAGDMSYAFFRRAGNFQVVRVVRDVQDVAERIDAVILPSPRSRGASSCLAPMESNRSKVALTSFTCQDSPVLATWDIRSKIRK